jgi:hypothetical protein
MNRYRLDCVGDAITFSIDGTSVLEGTDGTYTKGDVGVEAVAFVPNEIPDPIGASATVEFDNLVIREAPA